VEVKDLAPVDRFQLADDCLKPFLACESSAVRMFLSPFWAGTAHIVQLGPIWIEHRGREPAPPPRRRAEDAPRSRGLEQHSGNIRV
jgi:hypothetical protein